MKVTTIQPQATQKTNDSESNTNNQPSPSSVTTPVDRVEISNKSALASPLSDDSVEEIQSQVRELQAAVESFIRQKIAGPEKHSDPTK